MKTVSTLSISHAALALLAVVPLVISAACDRESAPAAPAPTESEVVTSSSTFYDGTTQLPSSIVPFQMHASWAYSYGSLDELRAASDLVVLATVTGLRGVEVEERNTDDGQPLSALAFSRWDLSVDRVIKGTITDGETILVNQTGAQSPTGVQEIQDDPLFAQGDQYLLFLKAVPGGMYAVLGGPAGRLVVRNGAVSSLSAEHPAREIEDLRLASTPLDQVIAQLQ